MLTGRTTLRSDREREVRSLIAETVVRVAVIVVLIRHIIWVAIAVRLYKEPWAIRGIIALPAVPIAVPMIVAVVPTVMVVVVVPIMVIPGRAPGRRQPNQCQQTCDHANKVT